MQPVYNAPAPYSALSSSASLGSRVMPTGGGGSPTGITTNPLVTYGSQSPSSLPSNPITTNNPIGIAAGHTTFTGQNTPLGAPVTINPGNPAWTQGVANPLVGQNTISAVKIVLDGNLSVFPGPEFIDLPNANQALSNVPHSSTWQEFDGTNYNSQPIHALVEYTPSTTIYTATGELTFTDPNYDLTTDPSIYVGAPVFFQGMGLFIREVNNPAPLNPFGSIVLEDVNGNIFDGWQVGGFRYGQIQSTGGLIFISGDLKLNLDDDLDLSGVYESLLFQGPRTLNFDHCNYITGINIVDDMLFWTDGKTEPKKINIPRSIQGTSPLGEYHTRLINEPKGLNETNSNILVREKHVTVIKKAPKNALLMDLRTSRYPNLNYSGIVTITDSTNLSESTLWDQRSVQDGLKHYDFSRFTTEEGNNIVKLIVKSDINGNTDFTLDEWKLGSKVVLKEFSPDGTPPSIPINDYTIKGVVTDWEYQGEDANSFDSSKAPWGVKVAIKIMSISGTPQVAPNGGELNYAIDLFDESEKLFEFKFPRFSYRYKYQDGEYSTFAPWTNVAFVPSSFDYHPRKGYNLGMTNKITHLYLRNFIQFDQPEDVVEVDLLYKEEDSPNVYVIETIKPDAELNVFSQNQWSMNEFKIENENIKSVLPSNQMLRPWDNVPKKALAQEITGNRIVYGNYEQNYDLVIGDSQYEARFLPEIIEDNSNIKSIKSLREYQLGVVFTDKYGRETPVISNKTGTFKVEKDRAPKANKLSLNIKNSNVPANMEYFKFYIKETSGEYYNMAMDRYWDAEDGNMWVSFASADRNKIDIDSFLILKKGVDSDELIEDPARFKVVAIEDNAPDFIKIKKTIISQKSHYKDTPRDNIFPTGANQLPTAGSKYFSIMYWNGPEDVGVHSSSSIQDLHAKKEVGEEYYFQLQNAAGTQSSAPIRISRVTLSDNNWADTDGSGTPTGDEVVWQIVLEKPFTSEINKFTDDITGFYSKKILDSTKCIIWSYKKENSPEFDGRFFVKLFEDDVFTKYIVDNPTVLKDQIVIEEELSQKIYSFDISKHKKSNGMFDGTDEFLDRDGWIVGFPVTSSASPTWHEYKRFTNKVGTDYGNSGSRWQAHAAFFRGLNVQRDSVASDGFGNQSDQHAIDRRVQSERLNLDTISATPGDDYFLNFEDVWFIDNMVSTGEFNGHWGESYNNTNYTGSGFSILGNTGTIELAFGGIQPPKRESTTFTWQITKDRYDIVLDEAIYDLSQNPYYDDEASTFAGNLANGTKFQWKEDPNQQVFVINSVEERNLLRHEADPDIYYQQRRMRALSGGGSTMDNITWASSTFFRPGNYTKNYKLTFRDWLDQNNNIIWNPFVFGPIANGLVIPLTVQGSMASGEMSVKVDSLFGDDIGTGNHGEQQVRVGMVWDVGDSPGGWTAESTSNESAVIYKIDETTNTLFFKCYDGDKADKTEGSGSWPELDDDETIYIKQFGMNGLSRNSAKNINFFKDGLGDTGATCGVEAVGYTLQIVEPGVTTRDAEFPRFPAIFETEPKEQSDLDIYY